MGPGPYGRRGNDPFGWGGSPSRQIPRAPGQDTFQGRSGQTVTTAANPRSAPPNLSPSPPGDSDDDVGRMMQRESEEAARMLQELRNWRIPSREEAARILQDLRDGRVASTEETARILEGLRDGSLPTTEEAARLLQELSSWSVPATGGQGGTSQNIPQPSSSDEAAYIEEEEEVEEDDDDDDDEEEGEEAPVEEGEEAESDGLAERRAMNEHVDRAPAKKGHPDTSKEHITLLAEDGKGGWVQQHWHYGRGAVWDSQKSISQLNKWRSQTFRRHLGIVRPERETFAPEEVEFIRSLGDDVDAIDWRAATRDFNQRFAGHVLPSRPGRIRVARTSLGLQTRWRRRARPGVAESTGTGEGATGAGTKRALPAETGTASEPEAGPATKKVKRSTGARATTIKTRKGGTRKDTAPKRQTRSTQAKVQTTGKGKGKQKDSDEYEDEEEDDDGEDDASEPAPVTKKPKRGGGGGAQGAHKGPTGPRRGTRSTTVL